MDTSNIDVFQEVKKDTAAVVKECDDREGMLISYMYIRKLWLFYFHLNRTEYNGYITIFWLLLYSSSQIIHTKLCLKHLEVCQSVIFIWARRMGQNYKFTFYSHLYSYFYTETIIPI